MVWLPSATTRLSVVGCESGFPSSLCRDVSEAAFLLLLCFLCEGHTVSRWHVISVFLMTFFCGIFHLSSLICSAFIDFCGLIHLGFIYKCMLCRLVGINIHLFFVKSVAVLKHWRCFGLGQYQIVILTYWKYKTYFLTNCFFEKLIDVKTVSQLVQQERKTQNKTKPHKLLRKSSYRYMLQYVRNTIML